MTYYEPDDDLRDAYPSDLDYLAGPHTTPCYGCKGINRATCHITISKYDTEAVLSVCQSCLRDAPNWAGWSTWTEDMKQQRLMYLRGAQTPQIHEAIVEGVAF